MVVTLFVIFPVFKSHSRLSGFHYSLINHCRKLSQELNLKIKSFLAEYTPRPIKFVKKITWRILAALKHGSLAPRVHSQSAISVGSSVFAGSLSSPNRQTQTTLLRHTAVGRILRLCVRCGLIIVEAASEVNQYWSVRWTWQAAWHLAVNAGH